MYNKEPDYDGEKIYRESHWSDDFETWADWVKTQESMALSRKLFINNNLHLTPIETRGWAIRRSTIYYGVNG